MPAPKHDPQLSALRALSLVGTLGLVVVLPVVAGVLLGRLLDNLLGLPGLLMVLGLLMGLAGGLYGAWNLVTRSYGPPD